MFYSAVQSGLCSISYTYLFLLLIMEIYVRLYHKQELVAITIPKGSHCADVLERFGGFDEFYIRQNGYWKSPEDELHPGETVDLIGRLIGGKGGFGSMLRAIGAQIEKTTNREACRDLTGRRLRAINDERRYRHYARIKAQREMDREEKRRKKLESLATSEPHHEFNDEQYISERKAIPERVEQALEDAFSEQPDSASILQKSAVNIIVAKKKLKGCWIEEPEDFDDFDDTLEKSESDNGSNTCQLKSGKLRRLRSSPERSGRRVNQKASTEYFVAPSSSVADVNNTPSARQANGGKIMKEVPMNNISEFSKVSVATCNKSENQVKICSSQDSDLQETKLSKTGQTKSSSPSRTCPLDLSGISSVDKLIAKFAPDELKNELSRLGVKCGGTTKERAERLWAVKDLRPEDVPKKLRAKK
ncbi:UPF0667 protein C1orf55-like [Tropilaelaps mercedesae]|uniref:UPF0667 protein C1orf55-like n=1 Tax=Tropilaelaps mercedesae TaxID=418985 RepID=A0A1V9X7W6_9ACAR|nr:UPF0667 protein C1orf55-like [Tropilaelaps mercedesae]